MQLILTNKDGATLDLLNNDHYFIMSKCEALHGIETDIATIESPYVDGASVEMVKALPRGISMTFKLIPDIQRSINFFTDIVKTKQVVTLTQTIDNESIVIKGIATIPPYTRMMAACEITLDIYCGQPYWEDLNQVVGQISNVIDLLNFPEGGQYFTSIGRPFSSVNTDREKSFDNTGDVTVGMNIIISAITGTVENPKITCSTGEQEGWYMKLNITLNDGDEVEINTTRGNKYIKVNGSDTINGEPILQYLEFYGNDWLQLETGKNTFYTSADSGADYLYFTISYKRRYE